MHRHLKKLLYNGPDFFCMIYNIERYKLKYRPALAELYMHELKHNYLDSRINCTMVVAN